MSYPESNPLSVAEAADLLDVHPSRVRTMIARGQLRAHKFGGRWAVNRRSVENRRRITIASGRPYREENAWALLCLLGGGEPDWIDERVRERLDERLREDDIRQLAGRLHKRAQPHRFRAHASFRRRMLRDPRLIAGGVSAAAGHGVHLDPPVDGVEAYIDADDLSAVLRDYFLERHGGPDVLLHVAAPGRLAHLACDVAPAPTVAVDLFESIHRHCRRAGGELLEELSATWREADRG